MEQLPERWRVHVAHTHWEILGTPLSAALRCGTSSISQKGLTIRSLGVSPSLRVSRALGRSCTPKTCYDTVPGEHTMAVFRHLQKAELMHSGGLWNIQPALKNVTSAGNQIWKPVNIEL